MNRTTMMMVMSIFLLTGASLPPTGPVPDHRPDAQKAGSPPTQSPEEPEVKADHPESKKSQSEPPSSTDTPPVPTTVPTPLPSPATTPATEEPEPPPPIMAEDPQAYSQCLKALTDAGATFTEKPRIDDGDGCGIDKPLEVSNILPNVALTPKGTMRCEAALELSKWIKTVVIPAANQAIPDKGKLTSVHQASTYVCRKRNSLSVGKISEHARGNAIDIAALGFEKGKVAMTIAPEKDSTMIGAFQRTLNASACLYFTTVLAPGSDQTHMNHMHLHVIQRSHGFRLCRVPIEDN